MKVFMENPPDGLSWITYNYLIIFDASNNIIVHLWGKNKFIGNYLVKIMLHMSLL